MELNPASCCWPLWGCFSHKAISHTCFSAFLGFLCSLDVTCPLLWNVSLTLFRIVLGTILSVDFKNHIFYSCYTNIFLVLLLNSCKDLKRPPAYSLRCSAYMPSLSSPAPEGKDFLWCLINHSWNQYCLFSQVSHYWPLLSLQQWEYLGADGPSRLCWVLEGVYKPGSYP